MFKITNFFKFVFLASLALSFVPPAAAATYYGKLTATPDNNGGGLFYVSTSSSEATDSYKNEAVSATGYGSSSGGGSKSASVTFYLFALPNFGYTFSGWNQSKSSTSSSLTSPLAQTVTMTATGTKSSKANTVNYYSHFASGATVKDICLAVGDEVVLNYYSSSSTAYWLARVNSTFIKETTDASDSSTGYATFKRSVAYGTSTKSKTFAMTITGVKNSGTAYEELTVRDGSGNFYFYRIYVIPARTIDVGATTDFEASTFASKAWTTATDTSDIATISPTSSTASDSFTVTATGVAAGQAMVTVKNYATSTSTGALGATYTFYVTVNAPTYTYYAQVATEVPGGVAVAESIGKGWAYASRTKKEDSDIYQTVRSSSFVGSAASYDATSADVSGFYIFAFANIGYKFKGWSKNVNDPDAIELTDAYFTTPLSVTSTSQDSSNPTIDTYYAHFERDDSRVKDVTLAVGDTVRLSFYNETACTWSLQSVYTNASTKVEEVVNMDDTAVHASGYANFTRSHANDPASDASNEFSMFVEATAPSGNDFEQLTIQDASGNVYHYRIHVTNPRVIEKNGSVSFAATTFANKAWTLSGGDASVATVSISPTSASSSTTVTATGVAKGKTTYTVKNYAAASTTGALGAEYTFALNVIEPWPVEFCEGDTVVIYYHNSVAKNWYLLINGNRVEANVPGVGTQMTITLTASNPDTDTEILGVTSAIGAAGTSDLVVVTDGENFYAYRMSARARRVISIGETKHMKCSTVSTAPWRYQVTADAASHLTTSFTLDTDGGHSGEVDITGTSPGTDLTIYLANFKDDDTVNAKGATYRIVTDVKGAYTRHVYMSKGTSVTWGENYPEDTGTAPLTVSPASANELSASIASNDAQTVFTTLSASDNAAFGTTQLFTVQDATSADVVKYDVMAYGIMSMAVGQVAPGCLVGSAYPWDVRSSDPDKLTAEPVLYNTLNSGRIEAKAPGDFTIWATNAASSVYWYSIRAQVYDESERVICMQTNAVTNITISAATGLSALWSGTNYCNHITATLDNTTTAADHVGVSIHAGTSIGTHQILVKNGFHHETIKVFVGSEPDEEVILAGSVVFHSNETYDLPAEISSVAWEALLSDTAQGKFTVPASGAAGERVRLTGVSPGTGQVMVKNGKTIYVYEVEVLRDSHVLPQIVVGVGYTVSTNLTALSTNLVGNITISKTDNMIAMSSIANGKLTIVGVQDGTTTLELETDTDIWYLPVLVHERKIVKNITLVVGAGGTVNTYSYTYDKVLSYSNLNPDRITVTQSGDTLTFTPAPNSDGIAQVTVECFAEGVPESKTIIYGITIIQEAGGYSVIDYDQSYVAYRAADAVRRVDDDLVLVFTNVNEASAIKLPDGFTGRMDILAVGGGGGGGSVATGFGRGGGGGGAGGFNLIENKIMTGGSFGIQVGAGGLGLSGEMAGGISLKGSNGGDSVITNANGFLVAIANGGGGGAAPEVGQYSGDDGGSGGGGSWIQAEEDGVWTWVPGRGGLGEAGQGCDGGTPSETNCGGGGGGAMGNGGDGQTRGPGRYSTISGESVLYALGGFGGRSDLATPAAAGQGPGFGGDGGNGGPGGDGGSGAIIVRFHRLYKNILVPVPTTNDLICARYLWQDQTNCVPFNYYGRSFRSSIDSHVYDWEDVIDTITGTTNVLCELEVDSENVTNFVGVGYYNFSVTLKEGYAWEDDDAPLYGSTDKITYNWVIVEDWDTIDAVLDVNKTVWWSDKSNATIRVKSSASPQTSGGGDPKVLFLGSLCGGHGFTSDILNTALNAVTAVGDVDYYFFNRTFNLNGTTSIYDESDPPYFSGSLKKGETRSGTVYALNPNSSDAKVALENASGNHGTMNGFYNQIYACITNGTAATYDYIMFSFDRARLAERFEEPCEHEAVVAAFLAPYYAEEKVIWLVDEESDSKAPSSMPQTPWYPSQLTCFSGTYWESLDYGVTYWKGSSTILAGYVSEGSYGYVPYNALVGLMCPSNYPVDKTVYMANTLESMSGSVAWTEETLEKVANMACSGIANQCVYNSASSVSNLIASTVKVKPFNLYYKDKVVSPANGLTLKEVIIKVCLEGTGDTASTNETDWVSLMHWDAATDTYYYDDPTHATGIQGGSMLVDMTNNLVTACLSNITQHVWVRYDTNVLDADGTFCNSEGANYNPSTGQYEKNPNDGSAYLAMIDDLGVAAGVSGNAETQIPWRYTAHSIVGTAKNGSIFVAGTRYSTLSCAEGRDVTVYYRGNGGYRLAALRVDSKDIEVGTGYDNSYTFQNLSANHTVSAVYTPYYGTITPISTTNEYDGTTHVPNLQLEGWDDTYARQIRYSLTEDGPYYTAAEFESVYSTSNEVTCVGTHQIYCRVYCYQVGYGATLNDSGWVWVDTRVVESGYVTITKRPLALTAVSFFLDGEHAMEKPLTTWQGVTVSGLVAGDTINTNDTYLTFKCPDYEKVCGQYEIMPTNVVGVTDEQIVGKNYTLNLLPGVVSVIKSSVVIDGVQQYAGLDPENALVDTGVDRIEKIYDGVATNISVKVDLPAESADRRVLYSYDEGESWTQTYDGEKFMGVGTNRVWYAVEQGTDQASSVYFWVTNYNYVIINARPLTIRADSASKRYDGTALTAGGYEIVEGTLAEGDILVSAQVTGSQTVVGSCENAVSDAVIRCCPNNDVDSPLASGRTDDYTITYVNGTLTVTPGAIVIGSTTYFPGKYISYGATGVDDVQKTYDGLGTNIHVTVSTPASGATVLYTTNTVHDAVWEWLPAPLYTNAGTYVVHFLVEADNYAAVTNFAKVTIDPRPITVTIQNAQMKAGGTKPTYTALFTYTDSGEAVPDEITSHFTYTLATTNTTLSTGGTYDIVGTGASVQGNYALTFAPGKLTVHDRDVVTVTAGNAWKWYGDPNPTFMATVEGTDKPSDIKYALAMTGVEVGEYPIVVTGETLQATYAVNFVNGTMEIRDWVYPAGPDEELIPINREWVKEITGNDNLTYATASNFYYSEGQNGITNWMNYVLGLNPQDVNSVIYLDIEPNLNAVTNPTLFACGMKVRSMNIGSLTNVSYRLLKSTSPTGVYERVDDALDGRFPQADVPIEYFRIDTRFLFETK